MVGLLCGKGMSLDDDDPKVKLIDLGAATWNKDAKSSIIQTRHYRAPEVVRLPPPRLPPSAVRDTMQSATTFMAALTCDCREAARPE